MDCICQQTNPAKVLDVELAVNLSDNVGKEFFTSQGRFKAFNAPGGASPSRCSWCKRHHENKLSFSPSPGAYRGTQTRDRTLLPWHRGWGGPRARKPLWGALLFAAAPSESSTPERLQLSPRGFTLTNSVAPKVVISFPCWPDLVAERRWTRVTPPGVTELCPHVPGCPLLQGDLKCKPGEDHFVGQMERLDCPPEKAHFSIPSSPSNQRMRTSTSSCSAPTCWRNSR